MRYCFQLLPHPNSIYREAQQSLGARELSALLLRLGIEVPVSVRVIGGAPFFCFEGVQLDAGQLSFLRRHSCLLLFCAEENGCLTPLDAVPPDWLPRDLPEILKYKGKTSAPFTRMLLNLAYCAASPIPPGKLPAVLDPLCGRGTTLFAALTEGWNAVGIDTDRDDLREGMNYFSRWCEHSRLKHSLQQTAETCGRTSVPAATYSVVFGGETRTLRFLHGDTTLAGQLMRKHPADLIAADLPYGIRHAPQDGHRPERFQDMLKRALPAWRDALRKGGAMALSFNTLTMPRRDLVRLTEDAGLSVLSEPPYDSFTHYVEQAVTRDIVVAVRE